MKKIDAIISWSGDNYCAHAEIDGVVVDTNLSFEKLKKSFLKTLAFHLDSLVDDNDINYIVTESALLKLNEERLERSKIAKYTGINERQLGHYIQGISQPRPATDSKIREGFSPMQFSLVRAIRGGGEGRIRRTAV